MADIFRDMAAHPETGALFLSIIFIAGAVFGGLVSALVKRFMA